MLARHRRRLAPAIGAGYRARARCVSFAQERLWFLDQLGPGSAVYNVPVAMRGCRANSGDGLRAGLERIVRRHEALRTRFESSAAASRYR